MEEGGGGKKKEEKKRQLAGFLLNDAKASMSTTSAVSARGKLI